MIQEDASTITKRNFLSWESYSDQLSLLFLAWGKKTSTNALFCWKTASTRLDLSLVNLSGQVISHYNLSTQRENKIKQKDKRMKLSKKVSLTSQIYSTVLTLQFYAEVFRKDQSKMSQRRSNQNRSSRRKEKRKKDTM